MQALDLGKSFLNNYQKEVISECLKKSNGSMCLTMGFGKTLISLIVALIQSQNSLDNKNSPDNKNFPVPIIVVCQKSLVSSWVYEIEKFFGNSLEYETLTKIDNNWKGPNENTKVLIITPEILVKCYKNLSIEQKFVKENQRITTTAQAFGGIIDVNKYIIQDAPFLGPEQNGFGWFYSRKIGCLIVDEAQRYTKIITKKCQSICTISREHIWLLSGTMFDEPQPLRILGYYLLLHYKNFPNNIHEATKLIKSENFKGLLETTITRKENKMFNQTKLKINKYIISHELLEEEKKLYEAMKTTLQLLRKKIKKMREDGEDGQSIKKFSSYILAMITYLRQGIVCPIIPISNISLDILDFSNKSELSQILNNQFKLLGIENWLNKEESVKSSRIKKILETIDKHKNEKIVIFSCFRTSIDILKNYIKRKFYVLESKMSMEKRGKLIENFRNEKEEDSILLTTYELGSDGLNLQCAHVVIIMDFWWNYSKTNQAIARVLRFGQLSETVSIYFYTSNTGIERALFYKQQDKLAIAEELQNGQQTIKNRSIKMEDIIKLIEMDENDKLIKKLYT
jgi:SNF2 family DNA or RNA helicase